MRKRPYLLLVLTFLLLLTLAIPALAEDSTRFSHQAEYRIGGLINIDKKIGDPCTTGASKTQNITGYGDLTKSENIQIAHHIMALEDKIDWTTAEDAVRNLSVTSTIELCARPMSVAAETFEDMIYGEDTYELVREELDLFEFMYYAYQEGLSAEEIWENHIVPTVNNIGTQVAFEYDDGNVIGFNVWNEYDQETKVTWEQFEAYYNALMEELNAHEQLINPAVIADWHTGGLGEYFDNIGTPYSPGDLGADEGDTYQFDLWGELDLYRLVEKGVPGAGWVTYDSDIKEGDVISPYHPLVVAGELAVRSKTTQTWGNYISPEQGEQGAYVSDFIAAYGPGPYDGDNYDDIYTWEYDEEKNKAAKKGDRYVGNYFDIDSYVYTSGGDARRYISMSSPFSKTLLEETMDVTGMVEVTETFSLDNLEAGPDAITLAWHELF